MSIYSELANAPISRPLAPVQFRIGFDNATNELLVTDEHGNEFARMSAKVTDRFIRGVNAYITSYPVDFGK